MLRKRDTLRERAKKSSYFKKLKGLGTLSVNLVSQWRVLIKCTVNVVPFNGEG